MKALALAVVLAALLHADVLQTVKFGHQYPGSSLMLAMFIAALVAFVILLIAEKST